MRQSIYDVLLLCILVATLASPMPAAGTNIRKSSSTHRITRTHRTTSTHEATIKKVTATKKSTSIKKTTTTATSHKTASSSSLPTPTPNTGRRGLGYNDATLTQPFSLSGQGSKVSWAYNWGSSPYYPGVETATNTFNPALRYIPMLWSAADDLTSIWNSNVANAVSAYDADSVLAFNEPDSCAGGSACMNVTYSAKMYRNWVQHLAGTVLLGSPAVTNGDAPAGLTWLSNFMGNCTSCTIDFIALHWYGNVLDPGSFETYISDAHATFQKPIWITEFGTTSGTDDQVEAFLEAVLPWLDAQSYVQRYAYFMDRPGDPYLINANGTGMSAIGELYNMS